MVSAAYRRLRWASSRAEHRSRRSWSTVDRLRGAVELRVAGPDSSRRFVPQIDDLGAFEAVWTLVDGMMAASSGAAGTVGRRRTTGDDGAG